MLLCCVSRNVCFLFCMSLPFALVICGTRSRAWFKFALGVFELQNPQDSQRVFCNFFVWHVFCNRFIPSKFQVFDVQLDGKIQGQAIQRGDCCLHWNTWSSRHAREAHRQCLCLKLTSSKWGDGVVSDKSSIGGSDWGHWQNQFGPVLFWTSGGFKEFPSAYWQIYKLNHTNTQKQPSPGCSSQGTSH